MTFKQFCAKHDLNDWQAIVKTDADNRRMLLGFERKNKRSRKYRTKELITPPIVLPEIVAAHKATLAAQPSTPN